MKVDMNALAQLVRAIEARQIATDLLIDAIIATHPNPQALHDQVESSLASPAIAEANDQETAMLAVKSIRRYLAMQ